MYDFSFTFNSLGLGTFPTFAIEVKLSSEMRAALKGFLGHSNLEKKAESGNKSPNSAETASPMMAVPQAGRSEIGKRVRFARQFRGLSQDQLAVSVGYSETVIGKIESGVSKPQKSIIKFIAVVLRCSEHWLLTGIGDSGLVAQGKSAT